MKRLFAIVVILAAFLCGCSEEIDYMTGAEHIKTYEKTKSKIDEINKTLIEQGRGVK